MGYRYFKCVGATSVSAHIHNANEFEIFLQIINILVCQYGQTPRSPLQYQLIPSISTTIPLYLSDNSFI